MSARISSASRLGVWEVGITTSPRLTLQPPHSQVPPGNQQRIIFVSCTIAAPNRELHVQSEGVFHGRNRLQLLRAVVSYGLRRDQ